MFNHANIIFIGPMGAGKTTIGKKIAQAIGCDFYDSDRVIEEKTGVSIPLIFELEGEEGFRKRETEILVDLLDKKNIVLATGGGAVLLEKNRQILSQNTLVIFLNASLEQLYKRTCRDKNRPLLQSDGQSIDPKEKLRKILSDRMAIYNDLADIVVTTDNQSINVTVNHILEKINNREL